MEQIEIVSSGDAVSSPEVDVPYTSESVYLSVDPEQIEILNGILEELHLINEDMTEQFVLIEEQTNQIINGNILTGMFLGFIAGAILFKGLWLGGRK